ncbi:MAG TPA: carbon-nitrogen hydrolase family protein [Phycisphaerae bacterium]|nr:carbon-nitrogen hydrolase family protein [Phycisphaerae bacterium]HOM51251.1 carbon-nitrogen hydrolase family protein [Phycisphaerae bacterium]HOQ87163.1 carbon-nitrogen hydrolase family protein [Phycisphaerae bacterium]HPP26784.1 carbon-nitrogen hydrolase family protein [Phycisphaerae bacterium]HPU27603.1 carbon-nitrogen hydrolase family protein [Phycisphaerae bacterium]
MRWIACGVCGLLIGGMSAAHGQTVTSRPADRPAAERRPARTLRVAAVQMRSSRDLDDNVARTIRFIQRAARNRARVVVFPECSVTGYFKDVVVQTQAEALKDAEQRIAAACREAGVYAIVGMPVRDGGKLFNSAVVISPEGGIIERYHKMQLAEDWPTPGDHLSIYKIDGVWCTTIVCHDERYPELVRLPVLAGAQVVFYLSHESGLHDEKKLEPYRAQIQARAVENGVYVVHANAPANNDASGSHGHSRIILPDGNIMQEASIFGEDVLVADLDIGRANRINATNTYRSQLLAPWWRDGVSLVRRIE